MGSFSVTRDIVEVQNESDKEADVLREVPLEEWAELRDIFKKDWPYGIYAYYLLENYIQWKTKDASIYCRLYRPREPCNDGTFFLDTFAGPLSTIYLFTMDKSCTRLKECIRRTKVLNWSIGPFIYSVHADHWPHVDKTFREIGLQSEFQLGSGYFWIPKKKCLEFDVQCPPEVYISDLRDEDIITIDSLWPHKYPGSEDFIRQTIKMNGGLGLYSKTDDSICCWILINQLHGLGVLQTADEHKRKGYARILTMALCKKMAEDGIDVHTFIMRCNKVSQELFKSLGFVRLNDISFDKIKESVKNEIDLNSDKKDDS